MVSTYSLCLTFQLLHLPAELRISADSTVQVEASIATWRSPLTSYSAFKSPPSLPRRTGSWQKSRPYRLRRTLKPGCPYRTGIESCTFHQLTAPAFHRDGFALDRTRKQGTRALAVKRNRRLAISIYLCYSYSSLLPEIGRAEHSRITNSKWK